MTDGEHWSSHDHPRITGQSLMMLVSRNKPICLGGWGRIEFQVLQKGLRQANLPTVLSAGNTPALSVATTLRYMDRMSDEQLVVPGEVTLVRRIGAPLASSQRLSPISGWVMQDRERCQSYSLGMRTALGLPGCWSDCGPLLAVCYSP